MPRSRILALAAACSMVAATLAAASVLGQEEAARPQPPTATPNPVPFEVPAGDGTGVRLSTDLGDIVIGLFNQSAPVASANFRNLVESGYYDGLGFHRVVRDFVIQGGDPAGNGSGGPGYTIKDEQVVGQYGRGIVAMARSQVPDSQGSQFFVVLDDKARRSLEYYRNYTIFGTVIEGMDVVDAIAEKAISEQGDNVDVVEDQVHIKAATIEQVELPPQPTPPPPTVGELAAAKLVAQLPSEVGDIVLARPQVVRSQDFFAGANDPAAGEVLADIAQANGNAVEDVFLTVSQGQSDGSYLSLLTVSVPGVSGEAYLEEATSMIIGTDLNETPSQAVIAGHDVTIHKRGQGTSDELTIRVLAVDDVVYLFVADDATAETFIGLLPPAAG